MTAYDAHSEGARMSPHYQDELVSLHHGDCLDVLRSLPDASVDAVITDPPYGLSDLKPAQVTAAIVAWASGDRENVPDARGFMGRSWDAFVPPPAVWDECYRVLKPGGHIAAFAGTRTMDLMGLSIRMAGFEIRDGIGAALPGVAAWVYGSGMPKGQNIGKAIDKIRDDKAEIRVVCRWLRARIDESEENCRTIGDRFGFHPRMVEHWAARDTDSQPSMPTWEQWGKLRALLGFGDEMDAEVWRLNGRKGTPGNERTDRVVAAPANNAVFSPTQRVINAGTPVLAEAARWEGWNTSLKPSWEPIILARKPIAETTVAANVLQFGTGALNIDATRVGSGDKLVRPSIARSDNEVLGKGLGAGVQTEPGGRWPANVLLTHAPDCDDSACQPGCPASELDAQGKAAGSHGAGAAREHYTVSRPGVATNFGGGAPNGGRYGDDGGVSRFFPSFRYQAKAPTSERPKVNGIAHPTAKPLAVMSWLVKLLVAPGGTVLEPFAGSGTTVEACIDEGFEVIAVEREAEYLPLIQHRIDRANARADVRAAEAAAAEVEPDQPALFSA